MPCHLGDDDGIGDSGGLNPARDIWRFPNNEFVHYYLAGIHAGPQLELEAMLFLELDVEPADLVDNLQSRQHRPIGIVFVRDGVTEIRHESVAHVLGVVSFVFVDDLFRDAVKIGDAVAQVLGVQPASELAGVHEIARQQRHLPSVRGLPGGSARGHPIAGRNLRALAGLRQHGGAAAIAELRGRGNFSSAVGAFGGGAEDRATAQANSRAIAATHDWQAGIGRVDDLLTTYREAIESLFARTTGGIKPGLERTNELLARLGSPHKKLAAIHVCRRGLARAVSTFARRCAGYSRKFENHRG